MPRPSWQRTHIDVLLVIARRSTCKRLHTAACLVDQHNRMVASGYNGSIYGLPHCSDVGCLLEDDHCVRTVHAEANAIINAARVGVPTVGLTMYSLYTPCMSCAKLIAQAGITRVVIATPYDNKSTVDFLDEVGVTVESA